MHNTGWSRNMHNTGWSKRKSNKRIQFLFLFGRKGRAVTRQDLNLQYQNYEKETSASNVMTINKSSIWFVNYKFQNNRIVYISERGLGLRKTKKSLIGRLGYQVSQRISSCQHKFGEVPPYKQNFVDSTYSVYIWASLMDYSLLALDFYSVKWSCNVYSFIFVGRCTIIACWAVPQPRLLGCPLHTSNIRYLSWGSQLTFAIAGFEGRVGNRARFSRSILVSPTHFCISQKQFPLSSGAFIKRPIYDCTTNWCRLSLSCIQNKEADDN